MDTREYAKRVEFIDIVKLYNGKLRLVLDRKTDHVDFTLSELRAFAELLLTRVTEEEGGEGSTQLVEIPYVEQDTAS